MDAAILDGGTSGVVINVIEVERLADWPGCVNLPAGVGIGWSYDGTDWTPPLEPAAKPAPEIDLATLLERVRDLEAALVALERRASQ